MSSTQTSNTVSKTVLHVSKEADRHYTVKRSTRLDITAAGVVWQHNLLGCVTQWDDGKWRAYVPKWNDTGYEWHLLDERKAYKDRNLAVLQILDRPDVMA